MKLYGYSRNERLRKTQDFQRVIKRGRLFFNEYVRVRCLAGSMPFNRWAVVVDRKTGGAVVRNKIKRRIKEIIRTHKPLFRTAFDTVIFPKKEAAVIKYDILKDKLLALFKSQGLML